MQEDITVSYQKIDYTILFGQIIDKLPNIIALKHGHVFEPKRSIIHPYVRAQKGKAISRSSSQHLTLCANYPLTPCHRHSTVAASCICSSQSQSYLYDVSHVHYAENVSAEWIEQYKNVSYSYW